jgi:hypothetical protein
MPVAFLHHITDAGVQYSVGFAAHGPVPTAIETIPKQACVAAPDSDGMPREGAQVAELTNWMPTPVKPRPAACRCAGHGSAATSTPNPEIWSISTSRSSDASPTPAGTAS